MLKSQNMKNHLKDYLLIIDTYSHEISLMKNNGDSVNITPKRAMEWVLEGIQELECKTKAEMISILNNWNIGTK